MFTKLKLSFVIFLLISFIAACGFTVEHNEDESNEEAVGNAGGIMLAGEELRETKGILKAVESAEEVVITVENNDVIYRLSEEAKSQLENKEVSVGNRVTFTTYSIGDDIETIDEFL